MRKRAEFSVLHPRSDGFTIEDASKSNRSAIDYGGISLVRTRGRILRLIFHSGGRFAMEGVSKSNRLVGDWSWEILLVQRRVGGKFRPFVLPATVSRFTFEGVWFCAVERIQKAFFRGNRWRHGILLVKKLPVEEEKKKNRLRPTRTGEQNASSR